LLQCEPTNAHASLELH